MVVVQWKSLNYGFRITPMWRLLFVKLSIIYKLNSVYISLLNLEQRCNLLLFILWSHCMCSTYNMRQLCTFLHRRLMIDVVGGCGSCSGVCESIGACEDVSGGHQGGADPRLSFPRGPWTHRGGGSTSRRSRRFGPCFEPCPRPWAAA